MRVLREERGAGPCGCLRAARPAAPAGPRQVIHSHLDNEKGGSKGRVGDPGVLLPLALIAPDFALAAWLSFVRELSRLFSLLA